MANISVAELLLDADFVDAVVVLRETEYVGPDGLAVRATVPLKTLASMQAASGDDLTVLPDGSRMGSLCECITDFPLLVATDRTAADLVVWRGMNWTVVSVSSFANFAGGGGHYDAMLEARPVRLPYAANQGVLWDDATTVWDDGTCVWDVPAVAPSQTAWNGTDPTTWDDGVPWDVK
jgi:hypothetical protein